MSLLHGDNNASTKARLTLDPLHLEPVVEAQSGGQRLVIASAKCPTQAGVDVTVDVMQDYRWRLLVGGKLHLQVVRWPRVLGCLSVGSCTQPIVAASWDKALQSLLNSANARVLVSALRCYHEACNDVWPDL